MSHHESSQSQDEKADFFTAEMENGELVMKPFCKCGNILDETYFCEKCRTAVPVYRHHLRRRNHLPLCPG